MTASLVEITRGGVVERVHNGHVVVVEKERIIRYSLGDPFKKTFMRSAAKPIQVIPLLLAGGDKAFNLNPMDIAIMCGSHYCEPRHIKVLESLLKKIGVEEDMMMCGSSHSLNFDYALELAARHVYLNQLYNDCSGKHLGMLALCRLKQYPVEDYVNIEHPVQQDILELFCEFCETKTDRVGIAIDGCSAPVFSLSLFNMALAYLKLTNPDSFSYVSPKMETACRTVFGAMNVYPEMISGTGGFCTALIARTNGRLVGKIGADGVYCVGVKDPAMGIAVKIDDGNMDVLSSVVVEVLSQLKILSQKEKKELEKYRIKKIRNDRKIVVGLQRPCFTIG